ncbi:lytic murein transglycosylase B [Alginatibacterium sediminis]|nr:lytic murein transglycosylase B [Alginatibacterium sediminis]
MRQLVLALSLALGFSQSALAAPMDDATRTRIAELAEQLSIDQSKLEAAIGQAKKSPTVLKAITKPWEAKPWYEYRPIFLTQKRIDKGVEFWKKNQDTLIRAEQEFQVPAHVIVSIIGVETYYGGNKGSLSVLNSLYSLGFHYPKRAEFFSKEFAYYVKLAAEQGWDLKSVKGSYAGAMGYGQFIPSSYIHYGVDFDGDNKVDILNNEVDAIGSVANYFSEHHWSFGEPVIHPIEIGELDPALFEQKGLSFDHTWAQLNAQGLKSSDAIPQQAKVRFVSLKESDTKTSYWVARENFYVITRYNRSVLYAMAVHQLSEEIKRAYQASN